MSPQKSYRRLSAELEHGFRQQRERGGVGEHPSVAHDFTRLRDEGLIDVRGREVRVLDADMLEDISESEG